MCVRSSGVAAEAVSLLFSCFLGPSVGSLFEFSFLYGEPAPRVGDEVIGMTKFLRWRRMTWALVLGNCLRGAPLQ